jgi:hypothetical protein
MLLLEDCKCLKSQREQRARRGEAIELGVTPSIYLLGFFILAVLVVLFVQMNVSDIRAGQIL